MAIAGGLLELMALTPALGEGLKIVRVAVMSIALLAGIVVGGAVRDFKVPPLGQIVASVIIGVGIGAVALTVVERMQTGSAPDGIRLISESSVLVQVMAAVAGGCMEEFYFRGILQSELRSLLKKRDELSSLAEPLSVLFVVVLWMGQHWHRVDLSMGYWGVLGLLGLVLGVAGTRSIAACLIIHASYNLVAFLG